MTVMFEAFLQNQIESVFRQRTMSGTSMLGVEQQDKHCILSVGGGPLDHPQIVAPVEDTKDIIDHDVSNQTCQEIVNELDQAQAQIQES